MTTLVFFLAIYLSSTLSVKGASQECYFTAFCYMNIADIRKDNNEDKVEVETMYNLARKYLKKQKRFDRCGLSEVAKRCKNQLDKCDDHLRVEALDIFRNQPFDSELEELIERCDRDTWVYMLLLCKGETPGYWPSDLYAGIYRNNTIIPCGPSCEITAFHEYYLKKGKKFPDDFPADWGKRLNKDKGSK